MTKDKPNKSVEYKGRIFDSEISMLAWSIAHRIQPDKSKVEERVGLAIAAQIGINHDRPAIDPNRTMRIKLVRIQQILDGTD